MFEDIRHELLLKLLLSLTDPDILRQGKLTDDDIEILKKLAFEKLHSKRILKEHVAMDLLGKRFSNYQMSTYPKLNNEAELLKKKQEMMKLKILNIKLKNMTMRMF